MRKETDLSGIKALGHAMLNTDIRLTAHSPMVVSHPFTNSGITGLRDSDGGFIIGNLLENPDDLAKWRTQVGALIDDAESAYDVFTLMLQTLESLPVMPYVANGASRSSWVLSQSCWAALATKVRKST